MDYFAQNLYLALVIVLVFVYGIYARQDVILLCVGFLTTTAVYQYDDPLSDKRDILLFWVNFDGQSIFISICKLLNVWIFGKKLDTA